MEKSSILVFFFIFFSGECWGGTLKVFKARTREKKIESNIILVRKNQKRKKNLNHRNTQIVALDIHTKINKQKKNRNRFYFVSNFNDWPLIVLSLTHAHTNTHKNQSKSTTAAAEQQHQSPNTPHR